MKKILFGILLSFALMMGMMPVLGMTQTAYAAETWSTDQTINSDKEINGGVVVTGDVTVTIAENATLTVNGGISADVKTLTVEGKGKLKVTGSKGNDGNPGSPGDDGGNGIVAGNLIINGAKVNIDGGAGGMGGIGGPGLDGGAGGKGGTGVKGNVTVNSGSITVNGGAGGKGGPGGIDPVSVADGNGGNGGNGGMGVVDTVTVSIGSATVTGGDGGDGGDGGRGRSPGSAGADGRAASGALSGQTVKESDDSENWTEIVSGTISTKRYVKIEGAYPLWVGGTQVTSANMSGTGWSYTPATKEGDITTPAKLALNGYSYEGTGYNNAAIYAEEDLEIELTGDNTVTATSSSPTVYDSYGVKVVKVEEDGKFLKISGNGKLTATGGKDGIRTFGDIIIDSGTVEASGSGHGIVTEPGVVRINRGTVTASGSIYGGTGIWGSAVEINSGTVTASGGGQGIYSSNNSVKITDGVTSVIVSSNENAITGYVKNAVAGTGWSNTAGTEGKEDIAAVSAETGQDLSKYRKVQFPSAHTHDFTYTASGATITATCANTDGNCTLPEVGDKHTATLTIAAEGGTYDGTTSFGATITDAHSIQGTATVQYQKKTGESSYGDPTTTAPKDAGTYKASITLGSGDNSATAHVVYTIAKADPTANAPSGLTATYGQTLSDMTLTNPQGNTPGTWTWKDPGTTSVGNVGDNTFKANFTPTDAANYKSVEDVDVKISVGKAANPATVTSTASVKVGGSKVDLAQNVSKNGATGAVTYAISGEAQGCSISGSELTSGANTGSVTVNVAVAEDDNYNASAAMPITVTITSKDTQTITVDDVTVAYGDTGKKIEASTSGDGALSYEVKEGGEYIDVDKSTGMLTVKKPGSAIVTVTAAETSSYAEAAKDVNVTATKAEPTAAAVTANNRKYDGTKKPLVTADESILSGGTMQYALGKDAKTAPEEGWSETIPSAAEKGTYYVWYMVKGDANHNDSEPQSVTVTISEKGPEPVDESTITFDLNGGTLNGKTGKVAVKVNNGTVITLPEPTRDGYTFDYWEGSKYNAGDQYTVNGDHTFKAVWKTGAGGNGSKGGSSKKGVNTGDENTLGAWIVLLVAALTGTTGMVFARKRRND